MLARPWEGKEGGRETGKDEEGKVTSTLSNEQPGDHALAQGAAIETTTNLQEVVR